MKTSLKYILIFTAFMMCSCGSGGGGGEAPAAPPPKPDLTGSFATAPATIHAVPGSAITFPLTVSGSYSLVVVQWKVTWAGGGINPVYSTANDSQTTVACPIMGDALQAVPWPPMVTVTATVDCYGGVSESNESNNVITAQAVVSTTPAAPRAIN